MCTYGEMVAVFLYVNQLCVFLQFTGTTKLIMKKKIKNECCIVYLIIVQAVNVLLEFIFYKE